MLTPELQPILERLDKLEKQNRRLKLAGIAVLGVVALASFVPHTKRTLQAREFQLVDADGKLMGRLGFDGKAPELELYNQNGMATASLYAYGHGNVGGLLLSDIDSGAAVSLLSAALAGPELRFADRGGVKVDLGLGGQTGDAGLDRGRVNGNRSALGPAESGAFTSGDAPTPSAASLVMLGNDGRVVWRAP